jgi:transposase-like protein
VDTEAKYPKDFQEFLEQFKSEDACRNYLFEMRWKEGFVCPKCKNDVKYWLTAKNMIHCGVCGYQASLTAGTIFHGTRKPLLLWFHIMWWVAAQKTGVSASNMMDFMGFGSYKTVWIWLQKLRRAMLRPGRDKLFGIVEVDETNIGGMDAGTGKQIAKTQVIIATECKGKKIGRVRFRCVKEATPDNIAPFLNENIKHGSVVITSGRDEYAFMRESPLYKHQIKNSSRGERESQELLPHVHLVDSLVKRWLQGTHQGKVSSKYLPYYLDEFAFRFNKKISTNRGWLFYMLIRQAIDIGPIGRNEIIGK